MRTIQALKEKSCVHSALYASISRNDQASNAHFRSFPVKNYSKDPFRGWLRVIFCRRAASTPMSVLRVRLEREAGRLSLRVGAARLRPGERLARLLDGFRDQHVGIALPANDISLGPAGDVQTIPARVQAHEWVGPNFRLWSRSTARPFGCGRSNVWPSGLETKSLFGSTSSGHTHSIRRQAACCDQVLTN
jgi:hypothetical protein